jgi:hypothetical protein
MSFVQIKLELIVVRFNLKVGLFNVVLEHCISPYRKMFCLDCCSIFSKPTVAECVLLKSIGACFTMRINSRGSFGTPPKNSFMMKGAGMKHVDSLNVKVVIGLLV